MKKFKLISLMMLVASSLMFIQCTSDPIAGPQGLAGIDGQDGSNGTNGTNGVDGTASCIACHNTSHRDAIQTSYDLSGHAAGGAVAYAGSRDSCSRCHSNEGYINYITGKPAVAISSPTPVSCTTCHNKHSTFDFATDGNDFALRNMAPVTLTLTDNYVLDYGDSSNNCVSCHQPRSMAPVDDGTGLYLQANQRFYPHYGGQSTMLEGIQGSFIAGGTTAYPGVGTAKHRTGASCTTCHMGTSSDGLTGSHTFKASFTASVCTTCHTTTVPTEVTGLASNMAILKLKLEDLGLIDPVTGATIVQTTTIPFKTAQALWNYETVYKDGSNGVHNPKYATALISNAVEALDTP